MNISKMVLRLFRVLAVAAAVLFGCKLITAQNNEVELMADGIGISLALPPGLTRFSEEKLALVREKGVNARFIFSDSQSNVLLVVNTFGNNANETGLSSVAEEIITSAQKNYALVEVVKRDLISIKGKKWLRLSIKQGSNGNAMIDTYFVTDWVGQYVLLDFSATTAKYDSYKNAFQHSAQSVQLSLIADAPSLNKDAGKPARKKP